jgi:hypothetical protein
VRGLESPVQLVQAHRSMIVRLLVLVLALLGGALAACGPLPPRETAPREGYPRDGTVPRQAEPPPPGPYGYREQGGYARSPEEVSGPAVLNLLDQARAELAAGRADQAVAALETALNIEPRNPFIWQQLAGAHLQQQLPDQAEHKAQRSNSFAHGNPFIEAGNWRVIAAARQARGDLAGGRPARAR